MLCSISPYLPHASAIFGVASAGAWFYSSIVKVTREKMVAQRTKQALRKGEKPNFAGVSLDGYDVSATLSAQSKWNAIGAIMAAFAVGLQSISQLINCG